MIRKSQGQMENPFSILIVEDNPPSRMLLEKTLASEGYEVVAVANGQEAREKLQQELFRIVITDWMMPEMDGVELCRAIRNRDFEEYVFIMILTSNDLKNEIVAALDAGADDYLVKPFYCGELIARLNIVRRYLAMETSLNEANDKIRIMSVTDSLTKLYNRGHFTERLPHEIETARKHGHSISLIMCDIDHFKRVNDLYGHQSGDMVLEGFGDCLRELIRSKLDWVARYGGEEFVIVLPETEIDMARTVSERLRQKVSEKTFKIVNGNINITASFGVACYDPKKRCECISCEALIGEADKYLYQAKREGRDMVKWE